MTNNEIFGIIASADDSVEAAGFVALCGFETTRDFYHSARIFWNENDSVRLMNHA
jgi:hypothetical protein